MKRCKCTRPSNKKHYGFYGFFQKLARARISAFPFITIRNLQMNQNAPCCQLSKRGHFFFSTFIYSFARLLSNGISNGNFQIHLLEKRILYRFQLHFFSFPFWSIRNVQKVESVSQFFFLPMIPNHDFKEQKPFNNESWYQNPSHWLKHEKWTILFLSIVSKFFFVVLT